MILEAMRAGQDKWTAQMERRLQIIALLDCYATLLTDRQRELLDLYYNQDLSLAELAEGQEISRQAVHEAIKRGEAALEDFERRLGFLQKQLAWEALVADLKAWPIEEEGLQKLRDIWLESAENTL